MKFDGAVFQNGAHIFYNYSSNEEYIGFSSEEASAIVDNILQISPEERIAVETVSNRYSIFDCSSLWPDVYFTRTDFSDPVSETVLKILVPLQMSNQQYLEKIRTSDSLIIIAENSVAMITKKQATKWLSLNDCEMIQNCRSGVAMKNALPEVKQIAD